MFRYCAVLFCLFKFGHQSYSDSRNLLDFLSTDYTKGLRPRLDQSEKVEVTVAAALRSIVDYDVTNSRLTLGLTFILYWWDELMTWNERNLGNVSYVWMSSDNLWIPNVFVYTTLSENSQLLSNTDTNIPELLVSDSGYVSIVVVKIIDVLCEPYIKNYPYDEHSCGFSLNSDRTFYDVDILPSKEEGLMINYLLNNTRWEYVSSVVSSTYMEGLSTVTFTLKLRRHRVFLTLNMIVPVAILTIINPLVFVLPTESGERVSYSITIFLAFIVFLSSLADQLPEVNNPISIYNIFLVVQLLYSATIVVMVNIISWLEHRTTDPARYHLGGMKKIHDEKAREENHERGSPSKPLCRMINDGSFVFFLTVAIVEYIVIGVLLT